MSFTRRHLLFAGAVGVLAAAFGCRRVDRLERLARRFEEHFHYLDLDREGLLAFFRDYEAASGRLADDRGEPLGPPPFLEYLASTDFFPNGADESRPVRYLLLHDPYVNPCFNPFAEVA